MIRPIESVIAHPSEREQAYAEHAQRRADRRPLAQRIENEHACDLVAIIRQADKRFGKRHAR